MSLRRVFGPLLLALLSTHSADAGENLLLRLVVPKATLCISDGQISAELELRNTSEKSVRINRAAIGTSVDAMALYSTEQNAPRFGSFSVIGDSIKLQAPRSLLLKPGESHRVVGTFDLKDVFFHEAGYYQIRTDYFARRLGESGRSQQVNSNWVILLLESCSEAPRGK